MACGGVVWDRACGQRQCEGVRRGPAGRSSPLLHGRWLPAICHRARVEHMGLRWHRGRRVVSWGHLIDGGEAGWSWTTSGSGRERDGSGTGEGRGTRHHAPPAGPVWGHQSAAMAVAHSSVTALKEQT
jgi:hypothetical protein